MLNTNTNPEIVVVKSQHINQRTHLRFSINKYDQLGVINCGGVKTLTVIPGESVWAVNTIVDENNNHHIQNGTWRLDSSECSKNLATRAMSYEEFKTYFYNPAEQVLSKSFIGAYKPEHILNATITFNALTYPDPRTYDNYGSNIVAVGLMGSTRTNKNNMPVIDDYNLQAIIVFGFNSLPRIIIGTGLPMNRRRRSKLAPPCSDWYYFQSMNNNTNPLGNILLSDEYLFMDRMSISRTESSDFDYGGVYVLPLTLYNMRRLLLELCGSPLETCLLPHEMHNMY